MTVNHARITFATVASRGYIDQAAGLIVNLREFYPEARVVVCALDTATERAFAEIGDANVICAPAAEVWGEAFWHNLTSRMSVPERAFASKSALAAWAIETYDSPVLILDSDLLFLSPIDDVIESLHVYNLLLVPGRHPWRDWRKTYRFGLFSAGIIGIGPAALTMALAWRAMCFEACMATPFTGLYYEQKYLDYFVSANGLKILTDPGINVSQTLFKLLAPRRGADGIWRVGDGIPLRIYHASRSTHEGVELARMKADYNRRGLAALGLAETNMTSREAKTGGRFGLSALVRALHIGGALEGLAALLDGFSRRLIVLHRVLTLDDHSLHTRIVEAGRYRKLKAILEESAYPNTTTDPEAQ